MRKAPCFICFQREAAHLKLTLLVPLPAKSCLFGGNVRQQQVRLAKVNTMRHRLQVG